MGAVDECGLRASFYGCEGRDGLMRVRIGRRRGQCLQVYHRRAFFDEPSFEIGLKNHFRILVPTLCPSTGASNWCSPARGGLATGIQPLILDEKEVGSRRLEFGSGGEAGKDDASSSRVRWKGQALPELSGSGGCVRGRWRGA